MMYQLVRAGFRGVVSVTICGIVRAVLWEGDLLDQVCVRLSGTASHGSHASDVEPCQVGYRLSRSGVDSPNGDDQAESAQPLVCPGDGGAGQACDLCKAVDAGPAVPALVCVVRIRDQDQAL